MGQGNQTRLPGSGTEQQEPTEVTSSGRGGAGRQRSALRWEFEVGGTAGLSPSGSFVRRSKDPAEVLPHPSPPGPTWPSLTRPPAGHRITLPGPVPCTPCPQVSPQGKQRPGCLRHSSQRSITPAGLGVLRGHGPGEGSVGVGGAHMMVHRFLRRAPWKRMVVWTCLQRAQPTLFRSSLKSSRMCQLYLAEHSM